MSPHQLEHAIRVVRHNHRKACFHTGEAFLVLVVRMSSISDCPYQIPNVAASSPPPPYVAEEGVSNIDSNPSVPTVSQVSSTSAGLSNDTRNTSTSGRVESAYEASSFSYQELPLTACSQLSPVSPSLKEAAFEVQRQMDPLRCCHYLNHPCVSFPVT